MTVDVCPACGYPTIGPELCAFCRPVVATMQPPFPSLLAEPGQYEPPIAQAM